MNKTSINDVVSGTMSALEKLGLSSFTVWHAYAHTFSPIIKAHFKQGKEDSFDREIVTAHVKAIEAQYENGEISLNNYQKKKRGVQRLTEFHDTGKLEWSAPIKPSRFVLNEYYEKILADFVAGENVSPKAKNDIMWIGKKYFSWLIQEGYPNLRRVGADEVQGFMIHCSKHMASSGVCNAKLYMKKLYRYLANNGYSKEDYKDLLSFSASRISKLSPATSHDEIIKILEIIDRRTPQGKRDYAMILLGTVTGLRAIDITKMKLVDIDWKKGEIKIIQSKTGKSLALPLTQDVGDAVSDYILNGRPKTEFTNVFLTVRPPFRPYASGMSVGYIYNFIRKKAELPRNAFDGKGFHSLRRSLGKNLVTSGAPITMVAQILGNSDIDATQKYISLDSKHLKDCALDFTGIKLKRGVMSL